MRHSVRRSSTPLQVLYLTLLLGGPLVLAQDITTNDPHDALAELASEIKVLRASNDQLADRLESTEGAAWLNTERTAEIRGIVADVLADSQTRTALQASGVTSGYSSGDGFHLASADGGFTLRVEGQIQVRWVLNRNPSGQDYSNEDFAVDGFNGSNTVNGSKTGWGFQVRRAKVQFRGSVFDDSWRYQINGAFTSRLGVFAFEDVMITKHYENGLEVTLGQFKVPFTREELVSSRKQLAVDRSLVNAFFQAGRGIGVDVRYRNDDLSLEGYYGNGMKTALYSRQPYTNSGNNPTDFAFAGRAQWKIAGEWDQFKSFNAGIDQDTAVMIGVGGMTQEYNENANPITPFGLPGLVPVPGLLESATLNSTSVTGVTADISAKFDNLSFFAAAMWQNYNISGQGVAFGNPGISDFSVPDVNPWGFLVQGGYALSERFEVFTRYAYSNADLGSFEVKLPAATVEVPLGESEISVITLGVNYFINDNVKFTADWGINLESSLAGLNERNVENLGWGYSNAPDQWVLRAQLQLLF
jgi:hypothetical protein